LSIRQGGLAGQYAFALAKALNIAMLLTTLNLTLATMAGGPRAQISSMK
jgi:hypothetical protein